MFKELIWVEDFTEGRGIRGWLRKAKRFVQRMCVGPVESSVVGVVFVVL